MIAAATGAAVAAQGLSKTLDFVSKNLGKVKSDSYIEFSKMTQVEPPTIVDSTISQLPIVTNILQSALNQFAVYYIQAATIHMNIDKLNIDRILDPLNPNRDPTSALFSGLRIGSVGAGLLGFDEGLTASTLSTGVEELNIHATSKGNFEVGLSNPDVSGTVERVDSIIKDAPKLSIGKVLNLKVSDGENKADIPITVRLRIGVMESRPLMELLSVNQAPRGFFDRLKGVSSGELSFWRDFVACRDLVDEYRGALLRDTTGVLRERIKHARRNKLSAVLSLNPSIANFSAIYVVSSDTLENVAAYKRVDFNVPKTRQKIFQTTGAMIFAVVNTKWETVTFWRHSIDEPTELTFDQIKKEASDGKNVDINEIMRTMGLMMGNTATTNI